jgi:hypothetical protein
MSRQGRAIEVLRIDAASGALAPHDLLALARRRRAHPKLVRTPRLGIDVGGVIIDRTNDAEDTSLFGDDYLDASPVPGAFEGIRRLVDGPFAGAVFVISKAGPKIAGRTVEWLTHHRVFDRTGLRAKNVYFTRTREDKAPVCSRLGLTHFVDDHLDVLSHLTNVEHRYLFLGGAGRDTERVAVPSGVTRVVSWDELVRALA